jgi:hypothetical protein
MNSPLLVVLIMIVLLLGSTPVSHEQGLQKRLSLVVHSYVRLPAPSAASSREIVEWLTSFSGNLADFP